MKIFTRAMATAGCVVVAATMLSAQNGAQSRPMRTGPDEEVRHLVYIATPGDNGTDNQSGVVVLDADKNYSFIKRISYGLPASQMPGPKIAGIEASVPLQMLYVAANGHMLAIDLKTDAVAWTFKGESAPVERSRGAASGCCERPWTLPDGKTLLVGSSYNRWWYYMDGRSRTTWRSPRTAGSGSLARCPARRTGRPASRSSTYRAGRCCDT
jgi:hypothetical protein